MIEWQGSPLIRHVHARLQPQVDRILVSCNRNREFYARFGEEVFPDLRTGYQGPLAGLEAAAQHIGSGFVMIVPCDTPRLPQNLVAQLLNPLLSAHDFQGSFARSGDRNHYLCALVQAHCLSSVSVFLDGGGRAVRHWLKEYRITAVDFESDSNAFDNINQPE